MLNVEQSCKQAGNAMAIDLGAMGDSVEDNVQVPPQILPQPLIVNHTGKSRRKKKIFADQVRVVDIVRQPERVFTTVSFYIFFACKVLKSIYV